MRRQNTSIAYKCLPLIVLILLVAFCDLCAAQEGVGSRREVSSTSSSVTVRFEEGLLSVDAENASLKAILSEISKKSGVEIDVDPGVEGEVTISFRKLRLEVGLDIVLEMIDEKNVAIEYRRSDSAEEGYFVERISVLRAGEDRDVEKNGTSSTTEEAAEKNIVRYLDGHLTVKVEDMDVIELFYEIERQTRLHRKTECKIIVLDLMRHRLTIDIESEGFVAALDKILYAIRPERYKGDFSSKVMIKKDRRNVAMSTYTIRRMSQAELKRKEEKIKNYIVKGKKLSKAGAYFDAQGYFERVLAEDRYNIDAFYYIGENELRRGRTPSAELAFKRVIQNDPGYSGAYFGLAMANERMGNIEGTVANLERFIQISEDEILTAKAKEKVAEIEKKNLKKYYRRLAEIEKHHVDDKHEEAERAYADLINEYPKQKETYERLASLYMIKGNHSKANDIIMKLMERDPENGKYLLVLGENYMRIGDFGKAVETFNRIKGLREDEDLKKRAEKYLHRIEEDLKEQ